MKKILKLSSFFVALSPDGTAKFLNFRYSDELLGSKRSSKSMSKLHFSSHVFDFALHPSAHIAAAGLITGDIEW